MTKDFWKDYVPEPSKPADGTQVSKVWWDGEKLMAKPIPLEDFYPPVQVPVLNDNSNYRDDPPVAEPVAWKWHQAPIKTSWGHEMVVADLAIGKDNTVSVYCERDQTAKVEAMFNPHAQPAPVPDAIHHTDLSETLEYIQGWNDCRAEMLGGKP